MYSSHLNIVTPIGSQPELTVLNLSLGEGKIKFWGPVILGCDIYGYFKGVIDDNSSVNRSESFSNENDNDVDINNDVVLYLCAGFNIKF